MSNFFYIDFIRLVLLSLPLKLRNAVMCAFLNAMVYPITLIYDKFHTNRDANLYRLQITPQVCYLEKMLNDRFDSSQRRIYIGDGTFYDTLYIYHQAEGNDIYLFTEGEKQDVTLYTSGETGSESVDFYVFVPSGVSFNEMEMRALIDYYKLASKTYIIQRI